MDRLLIDYKLRKYQAARLARLAERRRSDGTRGVVARWAMRTLIEAADHEYTAIEALKQVWLGHPEDELWERLNGWLDHRMLVEQTLRAAVEPERPAASRKAIGAFCTRHGILPDSPLQQTVFYLLTGQAEQHRALDPDGSLLADAYRAAPVKTQEPLRQAMVDSGDLDMVRVVVGARRDRGADLTAAEAGDLARHLAAGGRWEQLWRLVLEVPIVQTVSLMGLFGGWEPGGEEARRLFRRLADPRARMAATRLEPGTWHVRITPPDDYPRLSVAPDGSRVAVLCISLYLQRPLLQVYELSGGALVWSRFLDGMEPSSAPILPSKHLLLLNGPVVITSAPSASLARLFFKVSFGGQKLTYSCLYGRNDELVHLGDGFVATAGNQIVFGSASGKVTRALTPDDLGIPIPGPYRRLVSWPRVGRFAIGDPRNFLILADQDAKLVAVTRQSMKFSDLAFTGPDALVTANRDPDGQIALTRWTRDGDELVPTRSTKVRTSWAPELRVIPGLGRIIVPVIPDRETEHWLEQDTLAPADPPEELRTVRCHSLRVHGDWVAVHRPPGVDLYRYGPARERLAPAIRPIGTMRLSELATVAAAEQEAGDRDLRMLLGLVRACLEHRFAREIEIGHDGPAAAGEYDIRIE